MSAPPDHSTATERAAAGEVEPEVEPQGDGQASLDPEEESEGLWACGERRCLLVARPTLAMICPSCGNATTPLTW